MSLAADYGVHVNPLCPDCYTDTAIILLSKIRGGEDNPVVDGFQLQEGLDVWHAEMRVNAALLNKENAERWIAAGLPLRFFTKRPCNED